ncbi:hypothetical protein BJY00DRAFT_202211 [Aspergillus carlsbadensis]|nr:hypothetical protein BJY00DRAFT_202211 [Aspergillus carlsbadensis]
MSRSLADRLIESLYSARASRWLLNRLHLDYPSFFLDLPIYYFQRTYLVPWHVKVRDLELVRIWMFSHQSSSPSSTIDLHHFAFSFHFSLWDFCFLHCFLVFCFDGSFVIYRHLFSFSPSLPSSACARHELHPAVTLDILSSAASSSGLCGR